MASQNRPVCQTILSLGDRRQASLGLGIVTNLETKDIKVGATTESSKNVSFFETPNTTIPTPPLLKPKDATLSSLEPATITYASRLIKMMNKCDNNDSLSLILDKETKNTNRQDNQVKIRHGRSYRFKSPYYGDDNDNDNGDDDDDGIIPLPSPAPTNTTVTSTTSVYQLPHDLHKHPDQCHSSSHPKSGDSNYSITSPNSPVTPSPSIPTNIPIIVISSAFVHKYDVIPQLSDHPMLGDMDDPQYNNKSSGNNDKQQIPGVLIRESTSSGYNTTCEENLIGKQLGNYYIRRLLGTGAFSKVYLAEYHHNELYAMKTINKSSMIKNSRFRSSIEREVAILKFIDHPHIVHIKATLETEHSLCIVLEYAKGVELFDFVQKLHLRSHNGEEEKVNEELVKQIFLQLVRVVQWMHQRNIVHRDLKLENILICMNQGEPFLKVTDFGLARVIDPELPILTTRCGSEEYAAPEIVQSKGYDGRQTDTWALGIILYALLVGYLPFRYDSTKGERVTKMFYRIVCAQVKWPKACDRHHHQHIPINPQAKNVVERILVRQPEQRIHLDVIDCLPWFKQL